MCAKTGAEEKEEDQRIWTLVLAEDKLPTCCFDEFK